MTFKVEIKMLFVSLGYSVFWRGKFNWSLQTISYDYN